MSFLNQLFIMPSLIWLSIDTRPAPESTNLPLLPNLEPTTPTPTYPHVQLQEQWAHITEPLSNKTGSKSMWGYDAQWYKKLVLSQIEFYDVHELFVDWQTF